MTKKARARGSARGRRAGRDPFVCVIRGDGIDVDIRVENSRSIRAIATAVGDSLGPVFERVVQEAREASGSSAGKRLPDLVNFATVVLSSDHAPDDDELEQVIAVLQRERDRRAEMRS